MSGYQEFEQEFEELLKESRIFAYSHEVPEGALTSWCIVDIHHPACDTEMEIAIGDIFAVLDITRQTSYNPKLTFTHPHVYELLSGKPQVSKCKVEYYYVKDR